jgi:hypothetical protein
MRSRLARGQEQVNGNIFAECCTAAKMSPFGGRRNVTLAEAISDAARRVSVGFYQAWAQASDGRGFGIDLALVETKTVR